MKLLQLPNPGEGGGLGNMLFAIASTIGLSLRYGYTPRFPANWKYRGVFPNIPDEWFGEIIPAISIRELYFEYDACIGKYLATSDCTTTIHGYLQSPKYWHGYGFQIKQYLMPEGVIKTDALAVHFRRGDYVGNSNYAELPMNYYLNAIESVGIEPVFFSDDPEFVKLHTGEDYQQHSEIFDFTLMAGCSHHIVSNSTFSWWAAYISGGVVVRPDVYFAGQLAKRCTTKDFWPEHWFTCETSVKYDLQDVTFVIPVTIDSTDRIDNIRMVLDFLNLHFDTNILVGEVNTNMVPDAIHFDMPTFHRTKVINDLTRMAKTPYVFNWDADVLVSPYQIYLAVKELRVGKEIVYPYDGTFYMVDRKYLPSNLNSLESLIRCPKQRVAASHNDPNSYGGAVGYNVEAFFRAGGENELHINYSNEDFERWFRFNTLEMDVARVKGALYHINHWRGDNSSFRHEHGRSNMREWEKEKRMNKEQLINYIKSWSWLK